MEWDHHYLHLDHPIGLLLLQTVQPNDSKHVFYHLMLQVLIFDQQSIDVRFFLLHLSPKLTEPSPLPFTVTWCRLSLVCVLPSSRVLWVISKNISGKDQRTLCKANLLTYFNNKVFRIDRHSPKKNNYNIKSSWSFSFSQWDPHYTAQCDVIAWQPLIGYTFLEL